MNKKQRLLAVILVGMMVVTLMAGCKDKKTSSSSDPQATTPAQSENPIKWSGTITVAPYMFGPVDDKNNVIKPIIEEKLLAYGYDVDIQNVYIENSEYLDILNVRLTSGEAPDIFESKGTSVLKDYYKQGLIKSWDKELFIKLCPTIYNYITTGGVDGRLMGYEDMFWNFALIDGKMVTVPPMAEAGTMLAKVMLLRGDWLDNLGVTDLPYTLDDFINLMYRFTKEDPDRDGADDTYGFSTSVVRNIFGAFYGYISFPDPSYSSRIEFYNINGKIECGDILPTNKDALAVLAKCYADGVIDPEFVAQNGENQGGYWAYSQPFMNGRIGASSQASIDHYRLPDVTGTPGRCAEEYYNINGNYNFVYAPWPAGPDGNYGGGSLGPAVAIGENAVYNANIDDAKLEAILSILDIFAKDDELALLGNNGIEGIHYNLSGPEDKQGVVAILNNEELNAAGVMAYRGFYGGPSPMNENLVRKNFYNNPVFANIFNYQARPGYKGGYNRDVYESLPSSTTYASELLALRDETFIKIIRGELSIDAYDDYVRKYLESGGQILIDEAQVWWDERN